MYVYMYKLSISRCFSKNIEQYNYLSILSTTIIHYLPMEVASLQLGAPEDFLQEAGPWPQFSPISSDFDVLSCWCELYEAISPPGADVLRHAVTMLERLGAVSDNTGAEVTPLGAKLAKLQVGLLGSARWI